MVVVAVVVIVVVVATDDRVAGVLVAAVHIVNQDTALGTATTPLKLRIHQWFMVVHTWFRPFAVRRLLSM